MKKWNENNKVMVSLLMAGYDIANMNHAPLKDKAMHLKMNSELSI